MKVEVLVKYAKSKINPFKELTEEEKEDQKLRRLIGNDEDEELEMQPDFKFMEIFNPKNLDIYYQPYILELDSVVDWHPSDNEHITVITNLCNLPVKMRFKDFCKAYENLTGKPIIKMADYIDKKRKSNGAIGNGGA